MLHGVAEPTRMRRENISQW